MHISCFCAAVHVILEFVDVERVIAVEERFHFNAHTELLCDIRIVVETGNGDLVVEGIVRLHARDIEADFLPIGKAACLIPRNPEELHTVRMYKVTRIGNEVKLMLIGESDAFLEPVETAEDSVLCMLFVVAAGCILQQPT